MCKYYHWLLKCSCRLVEVQDSLDLQSAKIFGDIGDGRMAGARFDEVIEWHETRLKSYFQTTLSIAIKNILVSELI